MEGRLTSGEDTWRSSGGDAAESVESVSGEPTWRSCGPSSNNVRSRARPLIPSAVTAFLHCIRSFSMLFRIDSARSFLRLASSSRPAAALVVAFDVVLSRVRTRSSPVMLFSRRRAAASRSCHSDLLTNSNLASATSCSEAAGPGVRLDEDDKGRVRSSGLDASSDGVEAVSLKRSSAAATLRPMPALEEEGPAKAWGSEELEVEAEEEEEEDLRFRGLEDDFEGDMVSTASAMDM